MSGATMSETTRGEGKLTIARMKRSRPPRTRKPARASSHHEGRPRAARRAARMTLRVVTIRPKEPPGACQSWSRRCGRTDQRLELGERLLDERQLLTVAGEVAVAEGLLGPLEMEVGIGDEGDDIAGRRGRFGAR